VRAADKDIMNILGQYECRRAFHGDLHNHGATGGTSDGKCTLEQWKADLEKLKMDFVAILDHKQVRHMYLPRMGGRYLYRRHQAQYNNQGMHSK
jgi:hypothetical protein